MARPTRSLPLPMTLGLLTAAMPTLAESAPAVVQEEVAVRVDRTSIAFSGNAEAAVLSAVKERMPELDRATAGGLTLATTSRPLLRAGLELVEVRGRVGQIPFAWPIARAVVDRQSSRIGLVTTSGVLPMPQSLVISLTETEAVATLDASSLPGSRGADFATLVAVSGPNTTRLAWLVDPPLDLRHATNPVFLVDARTGAIEVAYDRVRTAKVRAFETNPVTHPVAGEYDLLHWDQNAGQLVGPYFAAKTCTAAGQWGCNSSSIAVPDAQGNYFYPAPDVTVTADNVKPDDAFAEVSMYYHADKFLEHLESFGFPGLACHLDGQRATLIANYRQFDDMGGWVPFDNAFYSGDCDGTMVFGQGTDVDFAYDGDVVYHELGHGVVEQQRDGAPLGRARRRPDALVVDAGGLNEAIADFVSSTYAGDPVVGDYVGTYWKKLASNGIRNNDNDYVCPHDLIGEVHLDGEPFAGVMWRAFEQLGDAMIPVVLDTTSVLPNDATLEEGGAALAAMAAMHLGSAAEAMIDADVQARNMVDCQRITTPDKLRREMLVRGSGSYLPYAPPPLQLHVRVPAGAETLELSFEVTARVSPFGGGEPDLDPAIVLKRNGPLTFTYEEGEDAIMVDCDWDAGFEHEADGELTIPVSPGEDLHLAFVNFGTSDMLVDDIVTMFPGVGEGTGTDGGEGSSTTNGESESESDTGSAMTTDSGDTDPANTDSDGSGASDSTGSCACRSSSPAGGSLALLMALAALFSRRRRD